LDVTVPTMNADREARKKALEAAKERLAFRRRQKEQLQLLRQQKQSGDSAGFESQPRRNDYGKKLVDDTKQLISDWTSSKEQEERKMEASNADEAAKDSSKQIVPGPRADLSMVNNVNACDLMHRSRVDYVKEVQTDAVEIGQHAQLITEDTGIDELNDILATFIESDANPWPSKKESVQRRITVQTEQITAAESKQSKDDGKEESKEESKEEEEESALDLSSFIESASASFLTSFRDRSFVLEAALGINEEHSVFIEAHSAVRDMAETSEMEKLVKSGELCPVFTQGRAITCLDYDVHFGDRFLASYSGAVSSSASSAAASMASESASWTRIASDGLVNVFVKEERERKEKGREEKESEKEKEVESGYRLDRSLECQSMINCVAFHPTKRNMILGASISGQVLGWDLRSTKRTPTIRTEFSSSSHGPSHSQPIFALRFLPSMGFMPSSKISQIVTLSNDAKMCVWRDDMLYKPNNELTVRLAKQDKAGAGQAQSGQGVSAQSKEITTTCFSFARGFSETAPTLWMGSDEGSIYATQLTLTKQREDGKPTELPISSVLPTAHFGPITALSFHPDPHGKQEAIGGLFLTSSFDWTVKLWHTSSARPVSLFNNMQDYVYDVAWSPTNPSIFAAGDGSGNLTLFDLNASFEHPASEPTNIVDAEREQSRSAEMVSITKLMWSPNGKQIIVGDSSGKISIFDCPVYDSTDNDSDKFAAIIRRKLDANADR